VRLLRRRSHGEDGRAAESAASQGTTSSSTTGGGDTVDPRHSSGKGRPTPKRREAQRRRTGPVAPPPRTRREAYRRQKEQTAVRRVAHREGLRSGNEKYLTPRDRGPVRGLVRDIIDSRRNAGGLFLPIAAIVFAGYLVPNTRLRALTMTLWMTVFLLLVLDSIWLGIRIRRLVHERYPDATERTGRLVWYGVSRSTMIRRWRMPAPRVAVGDKI
jgi:Protein of unknown function (DUF3043)